MDSGPNHSHGIGIYSQQVHAGFKSQSLAARLWPASVRELWSNHSNDMAVNCSSHPQPISRRDILFLELP